MIQNILRSTMRGACVLMAVMLLAVGCDEKKEPAKPTVPKPPTPDVTPKAGSSLVSGAKGEKTGGGAIATTGPSTTQTPDPAKATPAKSSDPAIAPVPSTQQAAQTKKAQELLAKAIQSLNDNRLDDAATALDQVDAMKASLPEATHKELATIRGNLEKMRKLQTPDVTPPADLNNK